MMYRNRSTSYIETVPSSPVVVPAQAQAASSNDSRNPDKHKEETMRYNQIIQSWGNRP